MAKTSAIGLPLLEQDHWMVRQSWNVTTPYLKGVCEKTKQLKLRPIAGFAKQIPVTVGDALLIEWAAPSNDVAVRVLHQLISGTPGIQAGLGQVRKRLNKIMRGLGKHRLKSERVCSPESVALRLGSPFFLPNATSYPEILTVKQQAKADAANAKTEAARPGRAYMFFVNAHLRRNI